MLILENGRVIHDDQERSIISSCTSGLSNRLFNIAGCQLFARVLNRIPRLYWPLNGQAACPLSDLVLNTPDEINDEDLLIRVSRPEWRTRVYNSGIDINFNDQECHHLQDDSHHVILIKSWDYPMMDGFDQNSEIEQSLRNLNFNPDIIEMVDFLQQPEPMIGVHVRIGDLIDGKMQYESAFLPSTILAFVETMKWILERCPHAAFYISSHHDFVLDEFHSQFPRHCYSWRAKDKTRSRQGIKDALVELLHLSRSNFILGSHRSLYSRMAGILGSRPVFNVGVKAMTEDIYRQLTNSAYIQL